MEQKEAELVLDWFVDLEDRFVNFLKHVPITWNDRAVLPLLSGIIVESCGILDSVFRKEYDLELGPEPKRQLGITHFSEQYEGRYSLSECSSLVYYYPPVLLSPFRGWLSGSGNYESRDWWAAYNKLKHERIENYHRCTLHNAIMGLCALHQVMANIPSFFRSLLSRDMVALRGFTVRHAVDSVEQGDTELPFLIESRLFATPFGTKRFPDKVEHISGAVFGGSTRLERFLGS